MKLLTGICILGLASASAQAGVYGSEIKDGPEAMPRDPVSSIKVIPKSNSSAIPATASPQSSTPSSPENAPAAEPLAPRALEESFTLRKGESIKSELESWAQRTGWEVIWRLSDTWLIPNGITYYGDFKTAATTVVQTLADNGIVIRCIANDGNKTMLIVGAGVQE